MGNSLTVADFFCGAGGFSEGFRQAGFKVVFALDNWDAAIETHKLNHPHCKHILMDIDELNSSKKIDEIVPDVDVIIGSPPCIVFSSSNKAGKADKSDGIKLIKALLRIIAWKKQNGNLRYWILENVPNSIKYIKDKYTWKELGLPGEGPNLHIKQKIVLNAAEFGTPQKRKRLFCGDFPILKKPNRKISEIPFSYVLKKIPNPLIGSKRSKIEDPVYGFKIRKSDLVDHYYDTRVASFEWKRAKRLKEDHGYMGKMSFPEDLTKPARTIMATRSASTRESMIIEAVNAKNRKVGYRLPTIRELASLMSFPLTYQFEATNESDKYRLVGNAVCPKLSNSLAKSIMLSLGVKSRMSWVSNKIKFPKISLDGSKRIIKKPKQRRYDARYINHVPQLKMKNFRVDLNNLKSDFNKRKVRWSSTLHHGTGKGALRFNIQIHQLKDNTKEYYFLNKFNKDLMKEFNKAGLDSSKLQQSYVMNGHSTELNPDDILSLIKEKIDLYFPNKEEKMIYLKPIGRNVPLKIVAALYACQSFLNILEQKDNLRQQNGSR